MVRLHGVCGGALNMVGPQRRSTGLPLPRQRRCTALRRRDTRSCRSPIPLHHAFNNKVMNVLRMTFCATWASVAEGPRGRADVPGEAPKRCQQMRREAVGGGRVWNVSHASWRRRALNADAVTPDAGIGRLGELWIAQTTASGRSVSVSVSGDGSPRLAGRRRAGRG